MKILGAAIWALVTMLIFPLTLMVYADRHTAAEGDPGATVYNKPVPMAAQDGTYTLDPESYKPKLTISQQISDKGQTAIMCYDSTKGLIECPVVPFDVPPLQVKKTINPMDMNGSISEVHCMECPYEVTVLECADKSRFKLMSEDGHWHCLALGR